MSKLIIPLVTKNLEIRDFVQSDLEAIFDTLRPETSGGRVFEKKTVAEAEQWLQNRIKERAELGYSIWAVETKEQHFVGVCGLIPWQPFPMICYAIRRRFQGNGFGTEAAQSIIERAADEFGSIISTIRETNIASIRVAEKIGMRVSDTSFADNPKLRSFIYP
ncbi:MAG: GNAT family N-acetyltransferase [Pseudomonadota bacterium]